MFISIIQIFVEDIYAAASWYTVVETSQFLALFTWLKQRIVQHEMSNWILFFEVKQDSAAININVSSLPANPHVFNIEFHHMTICKTLSFPYKANSDWKSQIQFNRLHFIDATQLWPARVPLHGPDYIPPWNFQRQFHWHNHSTKSYRNQRAWMRSVPVSPRDIDLFVCTLLNFNRCQ